MEGKKGMVVVNSKFSGNTMRQGLVSSSLALCVAKKMEKVKMLACKRKEVRFFDRIKFLCSYLHVFAGSINKGPFLELKLPNYNAWSEVFLKVHEEDSAGCWWSIFATELANFAKKAAPLGDLEMVMLGEFFFLFDW